MTKAGSAPDTPPLTFMVTLSVRKIRCPFPVSLPPPPPVGAELSQRVLQQTGTARLPPNPPRPGVLSCAPLLCSGHRHLPWRLPDDVLRPRVPCGPLQDSSRSPGAPGSSRRAVGEAAGPPPRGCSGGRVGHSDRRGPGQHPGLQALAERLAEEGSREAAPLHSQAPRGAVRGHTGPSPKGPARPTGLTCADCVVVIGCLCPRLKARLLGSPLTQ